MDFLTNPYFAFVVFLVAVAGFVVTMLLFASYLGPKNRTRTKQIPFECGSVPVGDIREQRFNVRFYLVAVLFILFDVEIVFMYPWALVIKEIGWAGFTQMTVFVMILVVAFVYEWKKGILDWNRR